MPGFGVTVRVDSDRVQRHLKEASDRVRDLRPVWTQVDERFTEREQEQFADEGSVEPTPGEGQWRPLSPRYKRSKEREPGIREAIMQRSGRLKESLVNPFAPGAVHKVGLNRYERGTSVTSEDGYPYPVAHEEGLGVPVRPVIAWTDEDTEWLADELADHLADPF